MKLKETTLDQRLFAGMVSFITFIVGSLVLGELGSKHRSFCGDVSFDIELTTLWVYLVLAVIGAGLGVLHLLSLLKFRK